MGALAGKKKKQAALEEAQATHRAAVQRWQQHCQTMYADYLAAQETLKQKEAERVENLAAAKAVYDQECQEREAQAEAHNQELAKLINALAFDVEDAVEEYVGIVLKLRLPGILPDYSLLQVRPVQSRADAGGLGH